MATNRSLLAEQIVRLYSRGIDREDLSPRLDKREVKLLITQGINTLIKPEIINRGDIIGTVIGTYELARQGVEGKRFVELTVFPLSLPKEQGIHRVYDNDCPWKAFVPIMSGDFDIAQGTPASFIEGQIGYYQNGRKLHFTKEVSATIGVKLIVSDPALVDDNDLLPIPPEMEGQVIEYVMRNLGLAQIGSQELSAKTDITNPRTNDR